MLKSHSGISKMIGRMVILGFHGNSISDQHFIAQQIKKYKPFGVVLFDKDMVFGKPVRNIESESQLKILTKQLKDMADYPLFIAIDQEGGKVNRLKLEYGFPQLKSHKEIGTLSETAILSEAKLVGKLLKEFNINLNFSPVVDVDLNPLNPIIGGKNRSFSSKPHHVSSVAKTYIKGLNSEGIFATLKHFPGHGSSTDDSHLGLVDVTSSWSEIELIPYKELIRDGFNQFVMTAHVYNKNIDPDYPATLSKPFIQHLLKENLHFEGLVISDDMQMGAISHHFGLEQAISASLNAGVNLLCFGNNISKEQISLEQLETMIEQLMENGIIKPETIEFNVAQIENFINKNVDSNGFLKRNFDE